MMSEFANLVVFITAANKGGEAERIANALIAQRKAACVNIIPKVNSRFWWQGKIDSAEETLLVVKTRAVLLNEVIRTVKEIHSYEVPEIIAMPIVGGNQDYLDWIKRETEG